MNWKRALIPAIFVIPFLILMASRFGTDPHAVPSMLVDKPAPKFSLKTLSGEIVTSESLKGKPYVINFWSTWCVPCKSEYPVLLQAARRFGNDVQFYGIVYEDTQEAITQYLSKAGSAFPHLMDPDAEVAIEFGVTGVPESFFVDSAGIVRHKEAGVVTPKIIMEQFAALKVPGA